MHIDKKARFENTLYVKSDSEAVIKASLKLNPEVTPDCSRVSFMGYCLTNSTNFTRNIYRMFRCLETSILT